MINVRPEQQKVILSAEATVGQAPRLVAPARRMIFCEGCGKPLLLELDIDIGAASQQGTMEAMNRYDPGGDFRVVARGGATILTTNRHLTHRAPQSRQCPEGRIWVGTSPQGVYAAVWREVVGWFEHHSRWRQQRKQLQEQEDCELPDNITSLLEARQLQPHRPVIPVHQSQVLRLAGVNPETPYQQTGSVGFTLSPNRLKEVLGGPLAPERLVGLLGGQDRRTPPRQMLPKGLEVRGLQEQLTREKTERRTTESLNDTTED